MFIFQSNVLLIQFESMFDKFQLKKRGPLWVKAITLSIPGVIKFNDTKMAGIAKFRPILSRLFHSKVKRFLFVFFQKKRRRLLFSYG